MYIQTLRLQDFQSHKDSTLQFHPQFNAIIGTGNSGKTAIVRALSFVLFGQWNPSWVRHGAKFCRITLVTDTSVEVIREKGEKTNKYIITVDGKPQVYENFGTKVPDEVEKVLNISTAKVGEKEELNLNLSSQLDPLFLISSPGSFKAKVLGKLSKAHYLDHALREINKDKKRLSGEKTLLDKEQEVLQLELAKYQGLEEHKAKLDLITAKLDNATTLDSRLVKLRDLQRRIEAWKVAQKANVDALNALPNLAENLLDTLTAKVLQLQKVKALRDKIIQFKKTYELLLATKAQVEENKQLVTDKYVQLLKENKTCPTCFSLIDEAHAVHIGQTL